MPKKAMIGFGVDADAVSGWYAFEKLNRTEVDDGKEMACIKIARSAGHEASPTDISRVYGTRIVPWRTFQ